ncbi:rod-binding protein [Rhizorhabdus sp.]|uniref:rod-binding protein n=1 Tax=Rhizorhabdus sp. TaxID=1968843 RepID=UPI0019C26C9F|nr:rod-binding protein [Rhizorhabdus sp.]MBD3761799.1 rod-binding protein [Rhizorhabdus sp.]
MINGVSIKSGVLGDPKANELDQLKAAAKQFEAIFTRQMLKSTREAKLADDDLFGSDATDQFREMQDSNLADQLSGKGAMGIADLLVRQFQSRVAQPAAPAAGAPATPEGTGG